MSDRSYKSLSSESGFITQRNRDLSYVLIDSKVQHRRDSPLEGKVEQLPNAIGELLLLSTTLYFIDTNVR